MRDRNADGVSAVEAAGAEQGRWESICWQLRLLKAGLCKRGSHWAIPRKHLDDGTGGSWLWCVFFRVRGNEARALSWARERRVGANVGRGGRWRDDRGCYLDSCDACRRDFDPGEQCSVTRAGPAACVCALGCVFS